MNPLYPELMRVFTLLKVPPVSFWPEMTSRAVYGGLGWVEYHQGDTNIIISVPHGGQFRPPFIANREQATKVNQNVTEDEEGEDTNNKVTTVADSFTKELARTLVKEYAELTAKRPHCIMSNLHRSKMDPNRPLDCATQGSEIAINMYNKYHSFILEAKQSIVKDGLLIDLHGQNHHQNSIEIGYLFTKGMLNCQDFTNCVPSVQSLIKRNKLQIPDIIHGENSLGAMFEEEGFFACPSPRQKSPGRDKYYKGGYITQTHGSNISGDIDAIQLEIPSEIRYENGEKNRDIFAKACARVLVRFMRTYYSDS